MKPYFECEYGKLYHGSYEEVLEDIDVKADLVLTAPPYNTTSCLWETNIDMNVLYSKLLSSTKDFSNCIIFGNEPFSTKVRSAMTDLYKYDMIWIKNTCTGFQHAKNMPLRKFENIMVFSKNSMGHINLLGDRRMVYNPVGVIEINEQKHTKERKFGSIISKRPSHKDNYIQTHTGYPNNVLYFDKDGKLHPTQKPVKLLEHLILSFSNEEALVLDTFSGSGSTAIAAINSKRKFICIEKEQKYCDIAVQRILRLNRQGSLL